MKVDVNNNNKKKSCREVVGTVLQLILLCVYLYYAIGLIILAYPLDNLGTIAPFILFIVILTGLYASASQGLSAGLKIKRTKR